MAERIVVDTDIISYVLKGHSRADAYASDLRNKQIVISFMTVAELKRWAIKKGWGPNRVAKLNHQLRQVIIYPVDMELCQTWAEVIVAAENQGRPISPQDAWIAATALKEHLPLVTNNAKDYRSVPGLTIITRLSD
jgi:tRNA(fMet)-specific endonuclease VapC